MLQVFDEQKGQSGKDQLQKQVESRQQQVESQLDAANAKILLLKSQLQDLGVASKWTTSYYNVIYLFGVNIA